MANLKNTRSVALLRMFESHMGNVRVMSAKFSNQTVAQSHSLAMAVQDQGEHWKNDSTCLETISNE